MEHTDNFLKQHVLEPGERGWILETVLSCPPEQDKMEIYNPLDSSNHNQVDLNMHIKTSKKKKEC